MPCSDVPRSQSSTWCRTMHTSSSRCQALEESSRSTETLNALSERRNIQRLSRQKYKAASLGNSRVRLPSGRTQLSVPGVTYNTTTWHVPSTRSSAAPTPALAKLQEWSFAYIITLWRYHEHRGRGTTTTGPECGLTTLGAPKCVILFFFFFLTHRTPFTRGPVRQ